MNLELFIDYVLAMLDRTEITRLYHSLEDLKLALPYIDYFKQEEFLKAFLSIEMKGDEKHA